MPKPIEDIDTGDVEPAELIDRARDRGIFVFDLETTGLSSKHDRIEGVAFYIPEGEQPALRAWYPFTGDTFRTWVQPDEAPEEQAARLKYERFERTRSDAAAAGDTDAQIAIGKAKAAWVAFRQPPKIANLRPAMPQAPTMNALRPLFEQSPGTVCVAHNLKFDYGFVRHASGCEYGYWERSCVDRLAAIGRGEIDPGPKECGGLLFADSMLADFLCDETHFQYGLKKRTKDLFGHEMTTYMDVMRHRKQGRLAFMADEPGADSLGHYAMEDCLWTWRIFDDRMRDLNAQTPGESLTASSHNAVDQLADVVRKEAPISPFDRTRRMGNLERIFWGIDMRVCLLLEEMESTGVLIDWQWLRQVTDRLEIEKTGIIERIERRIGWTLNPNSQAQVAALLFSPKERGGLGLPQKGIKRGKTGAISTGSKEIGHLKRADPIVADVLDWRSKDTIQANFSVKLAKLAQESDDQRIYSHFNQTGTKIFRLSSSDPVNLQNQPRDKELIRKAFCARLPDLSEAHFKKLKVGERVLYERLLQGMEVGEILNDPTLQLYSSDYSQIELRMAAHLSGDKGMTEVYCTGKPCTRADGDACERYQWWECESDVTRDDGTKGECGHTWTPRQWDPKKPDAPVKCPLCCGEKIGHQARCRHVDLHTRTAEDADVPRNPLAKNLNFGVLYRIGAPRFCQYANLYDEKGNPRIEYAEQVIEAWFSAYPAIHPFHVLTEQMLKSNGWYACTITGRRRRLDRERWKNEYRAITQGIQFQVSGSAQDILKRAMIDIAIEREKRIANARPAERRLWRKFKLILQVHDEITYVGPVCMEPEIIEIVNTKMEGAALLRVPLVADCSFGRTWQDVH